MRNLSFRTLYVIAAFISMLLIASSAFAEIAGKITQLAGEVNILRSGTTVAVALKLGDQVSVGDIVRTKSTGRAQITFIDNSTMLIAPRSRLGIDAYLFSASEQKRIAELKLYRGQTGFSIPRALYPAAGSKYEMKTRTAVAGVRGTSGILVCGSDEKVYVREGLIEFSSPLGSVMVPAGYVGEIIAGGPPTVRKFTEAEYKAVEEGLNPQTIPEEAGLFLPMTGKYLPLTIPITGAEYKAGEEGLNPQTIREEAGLFLPMPGMNLPLTIPITELVSRVFTFNIAGLTGIFAVGDGLGVQNFTATASGTGREVAPGTGNFNLSIAGSWTGGATGGPTLINIMSVTPLSGMTSIGRPISLSIAGIQPLPAVNIPVTGNLGTSPLTGTLSGTATGIVGGNGSFTGTVQGTYKP